MQLVRTSLRIEQSLKETAEELAYTEKKTLQEIFNKALYDYVTKKARKRAKKIMFITHDLGVKLDKLTRDDFYD